MSEREYFSVRYLIPGSTFLLLILAYNIFPLYGFLRTSQVSVTLFGAFLAVLGSPTVGFLVSQFWWKWREFRHIPWKMGGAEILAKKLPSLKSDGKNQAKALIVYDYIFHSELHSKKNLEGLSKYAFRRYDNYVLLSCANMCLVLGASLGIAGRLTTFVLFPAFSFGEHETVWLALVSIATVILTALLYDGMQRVWQDHKAIHEAIINTLITDKKIDENTLRQIFPDYFEGKTENTQPTKK
jgi:hypothetical protein